MSNQILGLGQFAYGTLGGEFGLAMVIPPLVVFGVS